LGNSKIHITNPDCKTAGLSRQKGISALLRQDGQTDLTDVTFLVPLRIDSPERRENADTLIKYTFQHFNTFFIVLEADATRKFYPEQEPEGFRYVFFEDSNEIFHRTKWINHLMSMAKTTFVAVWDADAIAPPDQIIKALNLLRTGKTVMSFPYDGRFYSCDRISCDLFKRILDIKILIKRVPVMRLMHGYHSVGGAFIVNKEQYLNVGGENENFHGLGPEDNERVKRMEILNLQVQYSAGTLFHLCQPQGKNSWLANPSIEKHYWTELQKTSKLSSLNAHLVL